MERIEEIKKAYKDGYLGLPEKNVREIMADIAFVLGVLAEKDERIKRLENLIAEAAPLAWSTGNYDSDAQAWEVKATTALETK